MNTENLLYMYCTCTVNIHLLYIKYIYTKNTGESGTLPFSYQAGCVFVGQAPKIMCTMQHYGISQLTFSNQYCVTKIYMSTLYRIKRNLQVPGNYTLSRRFKCFSGKSISVKIICVAFLLHTRAPHDSQKLSIGPHSMNESLTTVTQKSNQMCYL